VTADQTLAIFVGRLIPSKRVVDLLDAVALLRQTQPLLRVALVGEGPEQGSLRQHAAVLGITDRVIFAGRRLDIPDLLQASDLFVFPSETEGLSNAVIEAALVGLPIVACDIGGAREIVLDGKGAYLVPCRQPQALAAEIARVLDQPDEARRRAQLAQQLAEREFSIESVNRQLYQVYHEVLHA
jgi:glycosyltransferase involved in cell wall biosynthesis